MELTVNSLPARTWNHLGMNEARVTVEEALKPYIPEARWDPEEIAWQVRQDGCFGETAPETVMKAPMILEFSRGGTTDITLHSGRGSTLDAVLVFRSGPEKITSGLNMQLEQELDSRIRLWAVQLMSRESLCIHSLRGTLQKGARCEMNRLELGGRQAYTEAILDLQGDDSTFRAEAAYHGRPGQLLDMNYAALHKGKNTRSLMEVNGTLEEGSRKIFRGTIDFQQGCAGSKGTENENVLLMGEQMVNKTIPLILCSEEDVEGNHGASIGQLDEKVLFYLGTRGIDPEQARQIIARSRIRALCDRIPDQAIRETVLEFEDGSDTHEL